MNIKEELKGYFFTFRGNGYGPFATRELAVEKLYQKQQKDIRYGNTGTLFFGIVTVKDRELLKANLI